MAAQPDVPASRGYTLRARQERVDQTRLRITEATMRLHEEIGPGATTVSAIAELAGVTRLTVYRHFPDDEALVKACSAHWRGLHPRPDAAAWASVGDPMERLRTALSETYRWARGAEPMMTKIHRDLHVMPEFVSRFLTRDQQSRVEILSEGFRAPGKKSRRLKAALAHAVDFRTWHSLCIAGDLSDDEAANLMLATVAAAIDNT
ncbi:TetR family transcriptional regulator [Kribbella voronezhensis]|uniref:TetR family transcriptional regulator n=1 Tax=Kribbella voronezhensis TaxID=2512212 RepID=A0A4R7T8Y0_9ACTN|nr:TetR/AcrR family transcriptional regulator [Kribbella voronezhensis]TDU87668.1 TetR family transcriptional regulator [Kribbella voronezhensis]